MGFIDRLFHKPPVYKYPAMLQITTALTQTAIGDMAREIFVPIPVTRLVLENGEVCIYCERAVLITEKMQVVGRKQRRGGFSVRLFGGVTYHTGDGGSDVVRGIVPEYVQGKLYVTSKRIVFSADTKAFSMPLRKVVSYSEADGNLVIQFDNASKKIYLPTAFCALMAIKQNI